MDDAMKESVKITVIAAGFREVAQRKNVHQRPSYLPKTWKASRDQQQQQTQRNIPAEVARNVSDVIHDTSVDDLDVPTFLRRQAQKA
jgi:cell division GTPase FtsZ